MESRKPYLYLLVVGLTKLNKILMADGTAGRISISSGEVWAGLGTLEKRVAEVQR